jgi:tetratricopeptide (TPR) repeat protein
MSEMPHRENYEELKELLEQFELMRTGMSHSFLDEDAFEKIIHHFQHNDQLSKALEASFLASERYPYSASLLITKADILILHHRYREALTVLDQAAIMDSADINLYILRTDAYLALGQPEKAEELMDEALSLFEGEEKIELLFELADVYDDYEKFDKVFDCLKLVLKEEPSNEEALYKICFWTDFTGRNEEGIKIHQRIVDQHPYNELAWFNLGASYQGLKLYEKAIDAYKYATAIEEKFDYAYRNMGDAYIRLRKYKEAIEVLERVHEIAKPEDVIFEAIGHCYEKLKNQTQARSNYKKALHLRQEDAGLIYKIACTYFNEGQWEVCYKQLEHAIKIDRTHPDYQVLAGECLIQQERFKEAIQHFSTAVSSKPKLLVAWEALIRCLFKAAMYTEATEQSSLAFVATGGKTIFLYYKAASMFAAGGSKEALYFLEEAMNKDPKLLKKFIALYPSILQKTPVVDLIARFKRNRSL